MSKQADFPATGKVADALLALIGLCNGTLAAADTYEPLAKFFALSEVHLSRTTKSGTIYWHNRIQSAREQLAIKGFVERPQKPNPIASQKKNKGWQGLWILTPDGKRNADREFQSSGIASQNRLKELAETILKQQPSLDDFGA